MDSFNAGYNQYQGQSHNEDYSIKDNTEMYLILLKLLKNAKAKILFSINDCSLTRYLYKDYIKDNYNKVYATSHVVKGLKKKNTDVLIISNF